MKVHLTAVLFSVFKMGNCSSEVTSQVSVQASSGTLTSHQTGVSISTSSFRAQSSRRKSQRNSAANDSHQDVYEVVQDQPLSEENQLRWNHIFHAGKDKVIDPEDVHIVLETNISACINRLHSAETTLILRRVRKVVGTFSDESGNGKKLKAPVDDATKSRLIFQKDHLLDLNAMRSIFIAGDRWLSRGRGENWMATSLESYRHKQSSIGMNGHSSNIYRHGGPFNIGSPKIPVAGIGTDGNRNASRSQYLKEGQGDLVGAAYTLLLHLSETRWDHVQNIAITSSERAGLVLDANKRVARKKKKRGKAPLPPPLNPKQEEIGAETPPPALPSGISFQALTLLIAYSLRCSRRQRLNLLFHLLLGSDRLSEILEEHPAGGVPSWIVDFDQNWKLSYGSLGHEYYYKDSICIDALVAIETIGILLHNAPPQGLEMVTTTEDVKNSPSGGNRKRALSYGDTKYHKAKMHVMLSGYLRRVRSGNDAPIFEDENEQLLRKGVLNTLWSSSAEIFEQAQQGPNHSRDTTNESILWTLDEFMDWAQSAIPNDSTLDIIMHHIFGMGLLPTPSMERKLVTDSWIEWQLRELQLFDEEFINSDINGAISAMTNSIKHLLSFSNHRDNDGHSEPSAKFVLDDNFDMDGSAVWGGIGGFDGKGGLGNGIMYCIDKEWWENWAAYVGWEWYGEGINSKRSRDRPRELSSEPLLDRSADFFLGGSMGSYELMKQNLTKNEDYILVPPCVWDVLYELYGGGPPLPRMVLKRVSYNSSIEISTQERFIKPNKIPKSLGVATHPWVIECHVSLSIFSVRQVLNYQYSFAIFRYVSPISPIVEEMSVQCQFD